MQNLQPFIDSLQSFAQKRLGFEHPPKLFLKQDVENAKDVFGKTAYYDPNEKSITIFTTGRHPKDILRSIAHELVHHCQNLRGDLSPEKCGEIGADYAQQNDHMREMERQAFEQGNLCFRDWEDGIKVAMQQENNQLKENKKVVKISKKELKGLIGRILEAKLQEQEQKKKLPPDAQKFLDTAKKVTDDVRKATTDKSKKTAKGKLPPDARKFLDTAKKVTADIRKTTTATGQEITKEQTRATLTLIGSKDDNVREQYDYDGDGSSDGLGPGMFDDDTAQDKFNRCIEAAGGDEQAESACYEFAPQFMDDGLQGVGPEKRWHSPDDAEELEEGGCGKAAMRDDKDLEEGKEHKCKAEKCLGEDCPACSGKGGECKCEKSEELDEGEVKNPGKYKTGMEAGYDDDGDGVPNGADKSPKDGSTNESKIQTPEQEQRLYESRFNKRNEEIFDKLKKLWTK